MSAFESSLIEAARFLIKSAEKAIKTEDWEEGSKLWLESYDIWSQQEKELKPKVEAVREINDRHK